jgi:hypothetical protein
MTEQPVPAASATPAPLRWRQPLAVFAAALALRAVSLAIFLGTPYAIYPVLDARRYYEWALELLAGAAPPGPFLYEPLYSYLQAAVYAISGVDFHHLLILQALLGAAAAVLAYFILLEHLPPAWSLAGALAYAAYPVTLLSDTLPIKEPLATALLLAAVLLLQGHLRTARTQPLLLSGLLLGLVVLVRENLLALLPFVVAFLFALPGGAARALRRAGLLLAGVALAVLPVTARNCLVGGECALVAASGGSNLAMAFDARARGDAFVQPSWARSGPARLTEDAIAEAARRAGRAVSPGEASRYWAREGVRSIVADPARAARLLAERLWVSLGNDEISGNYPYDWFAKVNPLIGRNPLRFALLLSLGVVGWWCARRAPGTLLFPALFAGTWASFLPFWTLDRFRLPAVLPLLAGALFALREVSARARRGDARGVAVLLAPVAVLLAVSLPPRLDPRRRADVVGLAYARGADLYLQQGAAAQAGAYLEQAKRWSPGLPETALIAARWREAAGQPREALRELAVFRAWRRDFEEAELLQARLLAAVGERDEARRVLEEYRAAWPASERAARALAALSGGPGGAPATP